MTKTKIAISIDKELLDSITSKMDSSFLRSRSQAIEFFLRKGLQEVSIDTAVVLIKGTQFNLLSNNFKGKPLIRHQMDLFIENGIKNVMISTQNNNYINKIEDEIKNLRINVKININNAKGNAEALFNLKDSLGQNFVAISGDVSNNFELKKMIMKHLNSEKLATIGLMSVNKPREYGNAVLDGDNVIEFSEKPKEVRSNIANAGIYIFKKEVFELFNEQTKSLETDLLPKLAKIKQLMGYFTMGEYNHFG